MSLNFVGTLDTKIGKDITNFVMGYYYLSNLNIKGTVVALPDGVWTDEVITATLGNLTTDNKISAGTAFMFADSSSSIWTEKIPKYQYDPKTDTLTLNSTLNKLSSSTISTYDETYISQTFQNTNWQDFLRIYGVREFNSEFILWANGKKATYEWSFYGNNDNIAFNVDLTHWFIPSRHIDTFPNINKKEQMLAIMYLHWYIKILGKELEDSLDISEDLITKFITEWTLFVEGIDSGNPIFSWKWASNSFDDKYISQEESEIIIEYGTLWNIDNPISNPPKNISISWDSQPFTMTLEDIWALTNSKPSVLDDYVSQATKRKLYFIMKSKCGDFISDGIYVQLWESGKLNANFIGNNTEGYLLYGDDTFRYLEGQPPTDEEGNNIDENGDGDKNPTTPNLGNPTAYVQGGTTYFITPTTFNAIKQWLWSADFFDNIKLINNSPIDNIISVKYFPFLRTGTSKKIVIGNVDTGYTGDVITNTIYCSSSNPYVSVPTYFNNFLDYNPYTSIKIHLPFVGIKELDTNVIMGKILECKFIIDTVMGQIEWDIMDSSDRRVLYSYTGSCGMDIPLSSQNRSEVEIGYIASAVTTGVSLINGNVVGGVMGILNGAAQQYKTETTGNYNPSLQMFSDYDIYLIIERPTLTIPSNYGHTNGYPYNKGEYIKNVKGYTICENVDIKGTTATEEEKAQIKAILESGFYA